ncbi:MAG TPA: hypothetical protein VNB49_06470 [Candidatus Dormibacteraeota bacterium]|nr:hypothetical protein [Candidatus Dormibacteraeota bacterium]
MVMQLIIDPGVTPLKIAERNRGVRRCRRSTRQDDNSRAKVPNVRGVSSAGSREAVRDAPTRAGGDAIRKFVGDAGSTDKRREMIEG